MYQSNYIYHHGDQELHGHLSYDTEQSGPRPAVLIVHDWSGRNDFACEKADMMAALGYVGFAVDMYGEARQGTTTEEKMALMQPVVSDRALLRDRMLAARDALIAMPEVDENRVAALGFCFGGLCVLDLARSGADIQGVVSFHGLLNAPEHLEQQKIKAKVLALHGYDDPMVPPELVKNFCDEMTACGADWQVHMYGNTKHAFSNPKAHDLELGTIYNPVAESRAIESMLDFLEELFVD